MTTEKVGNNQMWTRIKNGALCLFAVGLCMLTLAGLSAKHKAGQASAQVTPESIPCPSCRFGMVGITRGQTIRLNVVNSADIPPGPCRTSGDDIPPGPCRQRVDLIFLDSMGRTLAHSTETLLAGRAAFLDFDGDKIERQGNRLELRPLVLTPPPEPDRGIRSFIVASAEVFNSETGRTVFFIPAAGPDPTMNDFSLSASPSSISVTSGDAGHSTISTAVTAGFAQAISPPISGLPAGASASFSPASITAGNASDLTITVSPSPVYTYRQLLADSHGPGHQRQPFNCPVFEA
jgi:hypothetical protein